MVIRRFNSIKQMKTTTIITNKLLITLGAFVLTFIFILWEYFNGGVVSHNLLAREDLPSFSNWLGLLTVPLLTWIVIVLIERRNTKKTKYEIEKEERVTSVQTRFLVALLFGVAVSLLWKFDLRHILQYFILLPVVIAFFKPIYFPEYLLGFVIGMLFTFGGVLPIMIGSVLLIVCFVVYKFIRILINIFS